jgi:hypothetical protein
MKILKIDHNLSYHIIRAGAKILALRNTEGTYACPPCHAFDNIEMFDKISDFDNYYSLAKQAMAGGDIRTSAVLVFPPYIRTRSVLRKVL